MPLTEQEIARKADFKACPILADYISTALQDWQFSENDEACSEGREARDCRTIYTLYEETYQRMKADCESFVLANAEHIDAALELVPGEDGLRYGKNYMTLERIGYYFWMSRVGHGVDFTDDVDAPYLVAMSTYCREHPAESLYMGDDGEMYLI
jgi:hypothetical protein